MIKTKITSSLENIFPDEDMNNYPEITHISALRGEKISLQLIYSYIKDDDEIYMRKELSPKLSGGLAEYTKLYDVRYVPVEKPINSEYDDNYLRTSPGLFPDLLIPLKKGESVYTTANKLDSMWVEVSIPEDGLIGEQTLSISFTDTRSGEATENSVKIEVIDAHLPEQKLIFTQWFYTDCLATYYNVPVWSKKHWEITENFAKKAAELGINMLLTPVFTPPLDTKIGGERPTTQLVSVRVKNGKYSFSFKHLDKWIEMCNRVGIKYLEISHLFTQWGASHAPKIMATVDGEYKQIFGWDTDAHGEEYRTFIRTFLKALLNHMKKRGDDKRCFFHISDEPHMDQLADYKKSKSIVEDILSDYVIMDALSDYEFYKMGIVKTPVPSNDHIKPFVENNVQNLWTYYCCGQCVDVANRLIAMPSWRNRSIGMQMFKHNIIGFLHWGYNFYYSQYSIKEINPYIELSGEKWVPAGDPFSVYPAKDGTPHPSLRALVFYEALEDMRAMQLCESLYSHAEVVGAMEDALGFEIAFDKCATKSEQILKMREAVNAMIKAKSH